MNRVDEGDLQILLSKCFTSTSLKRVNVHEKPPSSWELKIIGKCSRRVRALHFLLEWFDVKYISESSVNIVLRQNSPSLPKADDPQPSTSSLIQPPQEVRKVTTMNLRVTKTKFPKNASTAKRIAVTDKRHSAVGRWKKNRMYEMWKISQQRTGRQL